MRSKSKRRSRQAHWQAHLERARTLKMSLAAYCRSRGLSVQSLYNARHELSGKPPRTGTNGARQKKASGMNRFVAVELASTRPPIASGSACRIQLRDVVIECATLPEVEWLAALARGAANAVA
jgi:hypothetical protein